MKWLYYRESCNTKETTTILLRQRPYHGHRAAANFEGMHSLFRDNGRITFVIAVVVVVVVVVFGGCCCCCCCFWLMLFLVVVVVFGCCCCLWLMLFFVDVVVVVVVVTVKIFKWMQWFRAKKYLLIH